MTAAKAPKPKKKPAASTPKRAASRKRDPVPEEKRWSLLTVGEAAVRLHISKAQCYRLIMREDLTSLSIGRLRRVPVAAIEAYIRDHATRQLPA